MKKILIFLLLITATLCFAANKPLPVGQAFQLSASKGIDSTLLVKFDIAPHYYLYKDRLSFDVIKPNDVRIGKIIYRKGTPKDDEIFGKYQVYKNNVIIPLPIIQPGDKTVQIKVNYQGCSEWGYCYPPMSHLVSANFATGIVNTDVIIPSAQSKIVALLANKTLLVILLSFFGMGILLSFTPCVLPMIPILSGIIVGHGDKISTKKAFFLSLIYVLAMAFTYAIAGVIIGLIGGSIQTALQTPLVLILFSLVFVALALSMFGVYEIKMPEKLENKLASISHKQKSGSFLSVAIMGVLATLIVSPCVTPALVGALTYIGKSGNATIGGAALFTMGLGMGTPLLIIGTAHGKLLPKAGAWMNTVKNIFGVIMLAVAIWLVERILPGPASLFLWASLFIGTAIFMNLFGRADTVLKKFSKILAIILVVYGSTMVVGAALGNSDPLHPLANINGKHKQTPLFNRIKSENDVKRALNNVRDEKITMLDFYADWCVSCKIMERNTFSDPKVRKALKDFQVLQANVTANDKTDKALEKYFDVVAPPTILFFDRHGREIKSARIIGEMGPKEFLKHLGSL